MVGLCLLWCAFGLSEQVWCPPPNPRMVHLRCLVSCVWCLSAWNLFHGRTGYGCPGQAGLNGCHTAAGATSIASLSSAPRCPPAPALCPALPYAPAPWRNRHGSACSGDGAVVDVGRPQHRTAPGRDLPRWLLAQAKHGLHCCWELGVIGSSAQPG